MQTRALFITDYIYKEYYEEKAECNRLREENHKLKEQITRLETALTMIG